MITTDFECLGQAAIDSRLGRAALGGARAVQSAWLSSQTARGLAWIESSLPSGRAGRLRFYALTAAWAALGHLVILAVVPAYVAPGLPRLGVVFGSAALVIAACAGWIERAWPHSRVRRAAQSSDA